MARKDQSLPELLILSPWWISATLAAIAFFALKGINPLLSQLAAPVSGLLIFLAFVSAIRSLTNSLLFRRSKSIESLRGLTWKEFEDVIGEYFRRQGYEVHERLGGGPDGGVDLTLARGGERLLVQCKRWKDKPVPVQIVRELFGVMAAERADAGILITTSNFTAEAKRFAEGKRIELINGAALVSAIRAIHDPGTQSSPATIEENGSLGSELSDSANPCCPKCGGTMVRRLAKRGNNAGNDFWGCARFPKCRGLAALVG